MHALSKSSHETEAVISTAHPAALQAAKNILLKGGSAVDAAIAADAVLGVVEPMATNIGGDVFALVYEPHNEQVVSYNGTGRSPMGLRPELVEQFPGRRIPERHPLSVTVPGAVRGWQDLHARYGHLPWQDLFEDAIRCAQQGYKLGVVAARERRIFDFVLHQDPECRRIFRAGHPPAAHSVLTNPDLGRVLRHIAQEGADSFYQGWIPQQAAAAVQSHGGVLSEQDFYQHEGFFISPIKQAFFGCEVYQCPPNTHGVSILRVLKSIQEAQLKADSPEAWLNIVQATEKALAYARDTVADPSGNTVCTVIADGQGLQESLDAPRWRLEGARSLALEEGWPEEIALGDFPYLFELYTVYN